MPRRLLNEPLLHFVIAGGLLFALYGGLRRGVGDGAEFDRTVSITAADLEWMRQTWGRQKLHPPNAEELRTLVASYLTEALLAREAAELGLDENDTIVRRRLAQKMEFLLEDTQRIAEPGEGELRRLYDEDRDRYRTSPRTSFTQIFFRSEAEARRALDDIAARGPSELGALGDRSLLEREYVRVEPQAIESVFGPEFAAALPAFELDRWQGPVVSAYGVHLVRVTERAASEPEPFSKARASVLDEWRRRQRVAVRERYLADLMRKYRVVLDDDVASLIGSTDGLVLR